MGGIALRSSDHGLPRWLVVLSLCAFGAACASSGSEPEPRPLHVVPGWGLNTEPVSAVIEGENFLEVPTQHIGGEELVTVDARFKAFLGVVALEDVTRVDDHSLKARIPEGLLPGWHSLVVVGPLGQRVELPRAYYSSDLVLARLDARARLQRDKVSVGERMQLLLDVENTGGTVASAVTPVLHFVGEGQVEVLSAPEPVDIAPGGRETFAWELEATVPGDLRFMLEVGGRESKVGLELQAPVAEAGPLQIRDRAVLTSTLTVSPQGVTTGQKVMLSLRVTNPGEIAVRGVRPSEPKVLSVVLESPAVLASGPEPASADINAGESRDFKWTYTVGSAGTLAFQADAVGRDAHSGVEVRTLQARSEDVVVQMPQGLVARFYPFAAPVILGQEFDVQLEVYNPRDSPVLQVGVKNASTSVGGIVSLILWPPSEQVKDIPAKGRVVFTARLRALAEGSCTFSAEASGMDQADGSVVSAPRVTSSLLIVRRLRGLSTPSSPPAGDED
ncbi:hypothetical protein F0U60_30695 [Archangium minus]|uniref:DUF11 domain-containing protein n=1 Tax=Archangium minus TaxID=83450 RepID=A0ABY9WY14_9BACT|nr:hypothetical protein F0U60_30695 [Archangium minus]